MLQQQHHVALPAGAVAGPYDTLNNNHQHQYYYPGPPLTFLNMATRPTMQYYRPPALAQQQQQQQCPEFAYTPPAMAMANGARSILYAPAPPPSTLMSQSFHGALTQQQRLPATTSSSTFRFNPNATPFKSSMHNLHDASLPPAPRYIKNGQQQQNGNRTGSRPPPRQYVRKLRRRAFHGSESALCTPVTSDGNAPDGLRERHDSTHSLAAPVAAPVANSNGIDNRCSDTRTSNLRLQTYYTLVWEDEENQRHEPPERYSDTQSSCGSIAAPSDDLPRSNHFHDIDTLTIDGADTWSLSRLP